MRPSRILLTAALCAAALRCGSESPSLVAVMPSEGPPNRTTDVMISGRALAPKVRTDVGCDGKAVTDATFVARLRTSPQPTALRNVAWQQSGDLAATVPRGVSPGLYDLEVTVPSGEVLVLPQAFRIVTAGGIPDGGANCDSIFANIQLLQGGTSPMNEQNAADGINGTVASVGGRFADQSATWAFTFGNALPPGAVMVARIFIGMWADSGYSNDNVVLEVSTDAGQTWATLKDYGPAATLPQTADAIEGPFDIPAQTTAPAAGQIVVRLRGNGRVGSADAFTLNVDGVTLELCR